MSSNSPIQQTGIGLEKETILRADRLRFCYGKSRSHVIQLALDGAGLAGLEKIKADDVARFDALAAARGYEDWRDFAAHLVEIYGAKTYPPTLDVLESHAAVDRSRKPRAVAQKYLTGQDDKAALEVDLTTPEQMQTAMGPQPAPRSIVEMQEMAEAAPLVRSLRDLR